MAKERSRGMTNRDKAPVFKVTHILPDPGQGDGPEGVIEVAAEIVYRQFLEYERKHPLAKES